MIRIYRHYPNLILNFAHNDPNNNTFRKHIFTFICDQINSLLNKNHGMIHIEFIKLIKSIKNYIILSSMITVSLILMNISFDVHEGIQKSSDEILLILNVLFKTLSLIYFLSYVITIVHRLSILLTTIIAKIHLKSMISNESKEKMLNKMMTDDINVFKDCEFMVSQLILSLWNYHQIESPLSIDINEVIEDRRLLNYKFLQLMSFFHLATSFSTIISIDQKSDFGVGDSLLLLYFLSTSMIYKLNDHEVFKSELTIMIDKQLNKIVQNFNNYKSAFKFNMESASLGNRDDIIVFLPLTLDPFLYKNDTRISIIERCEIEESKDNDLSDDEKKMIPDNSRRRLTEND
jgi:hypothetical protein